MIDVLVIDGEQCGTTVSVCVFLCRYWEAIKYWDEALALSPQSAKLYEMKSQVRHLLYKYNL